MHKLGTQDLIALKLNLSPEDAILFTANFSSLKITTEITEFPFFKVLIDQHQEASKVTFHSFIKVKTKDF